MDGLLANGHLLFNGSPVQT